MCLAARSVTQLSFHAFPEVGGGTGGNLCEDAGEIGGIVIAELPGDVLNGVVGRVQGSLRLDNCLVHDVLLGTHMNGFHYGFVEIAG